DSSRSTQSRARAPSLACGVASAWVFVHQRVDPDAVELATELADLWRERTGRNPLPGVRAPLIPPGGLQGELF
ncbi:MAG: hypothetical protein AAFP22_02305, partial [Planctomycetota bacterium]